jgi:hypothetical protein
MDHVEGRRRGVMIQVAKHSWEIPLHNCRTQPSSSPPLSHFSCVGMISRVIWDLPFSPYMGEEREMSHCKSTNVQNRKLARPKIRLE